MALAHSKLTAQGQISVPAKVREKLGVKPGSILEWYEERGKIIVRRKGQHTLKDLHLAAFPDGPPKGRTLAELKEGIEEYICERHAGR